MVTLTERAAKKIQALASKKGLQPVLRVKVGSGGCSCTRSSLATSSLTTNS